MNPSHFSVEERWLPHSYDNVVFNVPWGLHVCVVYLTVCHRDPVRMTILYRHNRFPFEDNLAVFHILHAVLIGQVVYPLYHLFRDVQNRPLI